MIRNYPYISNHTVFSTWQKSQDKNLNVLITESSQASKCIILSFFCEFGYQNETFRNYYLAFKKHKKAWKQKFWALKSGKLDFTLGRVSCDQKIQFFRILQISHNYKGNFNQNNINKKNFNQKLMFFDFIYILTLLLEYRVTDLSGSEPPYVLWKKIIIIPPFDGIITPLFIVLNIPKLTLKMRKAQK